MQDKYADRSMRPAQAPKEAPPNPPKQKHRGEYKTRDLTPARTKPKYETR